MNSWKSTLLSAWAPPLSTFIIGTGRVVASAPPRKRYRGSPASAAAARATASETPRIALAPSRDLLGVPSRSIRVRSMAPCSVARAPTSAPAMSRLTLATAFATPLPPQASPPSRSSVASNSPVEAPEGTAARPRGLRVERHLDLDRRVSPRVEDLACVDALDRRHGRGSLPGPRCSPTRSRKRCAEARRASSGSTRRRRARSTSANSASPIQRSAASRVAGSAILCSGSAPSSPAERARRWSLRA